LGRDNSFPSKLFEFAMTGKAVVSTKACGVEHVLREDGIYIDFNDLERSLSSKIRELSDMDRSGLERRGSRGRQRIVTEYNWDAQARRMVAFLEGVTKSRSPVG